MRDNDKLKFGGQQAIANKRINWYKYSSPANFYPLAGKLTPWFAIPAAILFVAGLYVGFFVAPTDFQQGDAYRIIFIHVPAAWMGMFLYVLMAAYAGVGWPFNARLASMMASALSITGAMFTFLALVTGSFWGKPTWGTWWVWDARMTSTLILMFLVAGHLYLAVLHPATRHALRGMTLGDVDEAWARKHHPKWVDEPPVAERAATDPD